MLTFIYKLKCFLHLHNWIYTNKPFGEKSYRYCYNCRKEQETDYTSMKYQVIWSDTKIKRIGPKIRCLSCYTIIQNRFKSDFQQCECKKITISGEDTQLKVTCKEYALYEILRD